MAPCNREEADVGIFVHANHDSVNCMKKILTRTVDTDVVVLAIAFLQKLDVEELWFATCRSTRQPAFLTPSKVKACHSSMHSLDVILCYFTRERARRPPFKYVSAILRQPTFFPPYQHHRQCCPISNLGYWNSSWF